MNNNMLIKIDEKTSIFQKIRNFLKSVFNKNSSFENVSIYENHVYEKNNFITDLKEKREILTLQEQFETGKILEENISDDQKNHLINLYKEQIKTLEENLNMYKNKLETYKTKIIEAKKKIKGI